MKSKKVENIADYADYKVLAHLVKPRSPISVKFVTNDEDGWFIDKLCYKTKTGVITLDEGVNADSYEHFLQNFLDEGYVKLPI